MRTEAEVTIYGASDDLIEVEGAINEEFNPHGRPDEAEPDYLAFSDGTVLSIVYGKDGCWRINRVCTGTAKYKKTDATGSERDYTDRVTLAGDNLRWLVFGSKIERAKP